MVKNVVYLAKISGIVKWKYLFTSAWWLQNSDYSCSCRDCRCRRDSSNTLRGRRRRCDNWLRLQSRNRDPGRRRSRCRYRWLMFLLLWQLIDYWLNDQICPRVYAKIYPAIVLVPCVCRKQLFPTIKQKGHFAQSYEFENYPKKF